MLKVLVVDDERGAREGFKRLLEMRGHRVALAESGEEALRILRADPPDVMILDLLMGAGLSGWDVLREKLLDPEIRPIPVIVVTGLSADSAREGASGVRRALSGSTIVLPKPVGEHVLNVALTLLAGEEPENAVAAVETH